MRLATMTALGCVLALTACGMQSPAPVISGYNKKIWEPALRPVDQTDSAQAYAQMAGTQAADAQMAAAHLAQAPAASQADADKIIRQRLMAGLSATGGVRGAQQISQIAPAAGPGFVQVQNLPAADHLAAVPNQATYVIQPNDTLFSIAQAYNTSVFDLMELNNRKDPSLYKVGQRILIPGGHAVASAPMPTPAQPAGHYSLTRSRYMPAAAQPAPVVVQPNLPAVQSTLTQAPIQQVPRLQVAELASPQPQPQQKIPVVGHTLQPGETIASLSRRYETPVHQILRANNITDPTNLAVGQLIRVPVAEAKVQELIALKQRQQEAAQIQPAAGSVDRIFAPATQTYQTHTVQAGETLYRIGKYYQASVIDIMAANALETPQDLQAGMVLRVPVHTGGPIAASRANGAATGRNVSNVQGLVWPAQGKLLTTFGQAGQGVTHTGINIQLPENTPVVAADAGTVIYAGNGLKSYGNLVLLRHANGLVTAYGHNNQLSVRKNQSVQKGEVIALSGATGAVSQPQLHFEIRRNAQSIDPLSLLPQTISSR